jgi:hypothetical protein
MTNSSLKQRVMLKIKARKKLDMLSRERGFRGRQRKEGMR